MAQAPGRLKGGGRGRRRASRVPVVTQAGPATCPQKVPGAERALPGKRRAGEVERVAGGTARELMQADFPSSRPDEELDMVLHRQLEHDIEDMPVLAADGTLLGAVNLSEVLRAVRRGEI